MSQARRTEVEIFFGGVDVSIPIRKNLLALTYTDNEEDEPDDIQMRIEDRDGVWLTQWLDDTLQGESGGPRQIRPKDSVYRVMAKGGLNIRSGPGTSNTRVGGLSFGTEIEVEGISGGWAKIAYGGKPAYVSADHLEKAEEKSPGAVEVTTKGLKIQATIVRKNWHSDGEDDVLDCGEFELDDITANGPPSVVTISGTALPYESQIRQTKKNKAWESYSLSKIAGEIAEQNGMTCMYESKSDPSYERVEQINTSDIAFLSQLCKEAGISLKATNNIVVLFDQSEFERKPEVFKIEYGDGSYDSYKLRTGTAGKRYTSCRVSYTDPETQQLIQATARVPDYKASNKNNQTLEIQAKVKNHGEALAMAGKELRWHNKRERTAVFTLEGDTRFVAGATVILAGFGLWNGKYIISKAIHTISGGYTVQVWLRHVLEGY